MFIIFKSEPCDIPGNEVTHVCVYLDKCISFPITDAKSIDKGTNDMYYAGNLVKLGFRHSINLRYPKHTRIFKGCLTLSNMARPKVYVTRQINEEALNILQEM